VTERRVAYLLVGNPRSGSSLLAEALTTTGVLGRPEEYFWREQEREWAARFGLPPPDQSNYHVYVQAALRYGTTPNGVFAAKVFWVHAADLIRRSGGFAALSGVPDHERFRRVFGGGLRAVLLTRNCLDAALSLWRAETTGVWSLQADERPPPPPSRLDIWRVTQLHALMHAGELGWPHLLQSIEVPYFTLTYPEIASDLVAGVRRVARFVGVGLPNTVDQIAPRLSRQADATTERFATEWARSTGGCPACLTDRATSP
jgi:trehalose 2-sulfotransferase